MAKNQLNVPWRNHIASLSSLLLLAVILDTCRGDDCSPKNRDALLAGINKVLANAAAGKIGGIGEPIPGAKLAISKVTVTPPSLTTENTKFLCDPNIKQNLLRFTSNPSTKAGTVVRFAISGTTTRTVAKVEASSPKAEQFSTSFCVGTIEVRYSNGFPIHTLQLSDILGLQTCQDDPIDAASAESKELLKDKFKNDATFVWNSGGFQWLFEKATLLSKENRPIGEAIAKCSIKALEASKFPAVKEPLPSEAFHGVYCPAEDLPSFIYEGGNIAGAKDKKLLKWKKKPASENYDDKAADCMAEIEEGENKQPSARVISTLIEFVAPMCRFDNLIRSLAGADPDLEKATACTIAALKQLHFPLSRGIPTGQAAKLMFHCTKEMEVVGLWLSVGPDETLPKDDFKKKISKLKDDFKAIMPNPFSIGRSEKKENAPGQRVYKNIIVQLSQKENRHFRTMFQADKQPAKKEDKPAYQTVKEVMDFCDNTLTDPRKSESETMKAEVQRLLRRGCTATTVCESLVNKLFSQ